MSQAEIGNLFANVPAEWGEELTEVLLRASSMRIERIVSHGHASPDGFWYDQPRREWVTLLSGAARLRFEDESPPVELKPGDYLMIEAHRRHRVEWTAAEEPSIWLAIHFD